MGRRRETDSARATHRRAPQTIGRPRGFPGPFWAKTVAMLDVDRSNLEVVLSRCGLWRSPSICCDTPVCCFAAKAHAALYGCSRASSLRSMGIPPSRPSGWLRAESLSKRMPSHSFRLTNRTSLNVSLDYAHLIAAHQRLFHQRQVASSEQQLLARARAARFQKAPYRAVREHGVQAAIGLAHHIDPLARQKNVSKAEGKPQGRNPPGRGESAESHQSRHRQRPCASVQIRP